MGDRSPNFAGTEGDPLHRALLDCCNWVEAVRVLGLTPQQAKVVKLVLQGMKDKQIAAALGLSVPTIRSHLGRIFTRVGVTDRVELILGVVAAAHPTPDGRRLHRNR